MPREKIPAVRGTRDLFGKDMLKHQAIITAARFVSDLYGFSEWETPILEDTKVFHRLGETTDVVSKEMFTFGEENDSISLRPEGTAGICRALVSNGLTQTMPQKIFYCGPMFRRERPQKGRYRQFYQAGVEYFGPNTPRADAEVISCAYMFLQRIGVADKVTLHINTLGDEKSRQNYQFALQEYFLGVLVKLMDTENHDFVTELGKAAGKNPFRVLDSKNPKWQSIIADAPVIYDFLTDDAKAHYEELKKDLGLYSTPFVENPKIVRGLDYYSHTIFEFITTELGAQGAVLAGGRYDGLVEQLGGNPVSAVGWAAGIDRLSLLAPTEISPTFGPVVIMTDGDFDHLVVQSLVELRKNDIKAEIAPKSGIAAGLKYANKINSQFSILIKASETGQMFVLKNMQTGNQIERSILSTIVSDILSA